MKKILAKKQCCESVTKKIDSTYMPWPTPLSRPPLEGSTLVLDPKELKDSKEKFEFKKEEFNTLIKHGIKFAKGHCEQRPIIMEWIDNASVNILMVWLLEFKKRRGAYPSPEFEKLTYGQLEIVFTHVIQQIILELDTKRKKIKPMLPERKKYLKLSMQHLGKNVLQNRYSYNTIMAEALTVNYLFNDVQREKYRVFAYGGKLKQFTLEYKSYPFQVVKSSNYYRGLRYYPNSQNPSGFILVEKNYDREGDRWELHEIKGLKKTERLKATVDYFDLDEIETRLIHINNTELNDRLSQYDGSDSGFSVKAKLNEYLSNICGEQTLLINDFNSVATESMLVISPKGDMFTGIDIRDKFHHSSLLGGRTTFFAGMILVTNGIITRISGDSGHYRPNLRHHIQMLTFMRKNGLLHKGIMHHRAKTYNRDGEQLPIRDFNIPGVLHKQIMDHISEWHSRNEMEKKLICELQQALTTKLDFSTIIMTLKSFEEKFILMSNQSKEPNPILLIEKLQSILMQHFVPNPSWSGITTQIFFKRNKKITIKNGSSTTDVLEFKMK